MKPSSDPGRTDGWRHLVLALGLALAAGGCGVAPSGAPGDAASDEGGTGVDGGLEAGGSADAGTVDDSDPPVAGGYDALFVGNSFVQVNDVAGHYRAIASAFEPAVRVEQVTPGGYRLDQHAADARTDGTPLARWLRTGTPEETAFDVVVLQEQSQVGGFPNHWELRQSSIAAASELAALADARGAAVVLYETWGYEQGDPDTFDFSTFALMQRRLDDGYRDLAAFLREQGVAVRIAPVGGAFRTVLEDVTLAGGDPLAGGSDFDALYEDDGRHPSLRGAYLAACVVAGTVGAADVHGFAGEPTLGAEVSGRLRDACARTLSEARWQVPETRRPDAVLAGDPEAYAMFGRTVALSADGTRVLVGAAASARVLVRDGDGWREDAIWREPNPLFDTFVALSGDGSRALVGPPWRVYVQDGETWAEEAALPPSSAYILPAALSADGSRALVYSGEPDARVARLFARTGSTWAEAPLDGLDGAEWPFALDGEGARALVQQQEDRRFEVFARTDSGWVEEGVLFTDSGFGAGVLSTDGSRAFLTSGDKDYAVLFARSGTAWAEEARLWPQYRSAFGVAVAMSADGRRVVVGDPFDMPATTLPSPAGRQGSARVYGLDGGAFREEFLLVPPPHDEPALDGEGAVMNDQFGGSVAISADGATVVVGALGRRAEGLENVGAAYVFELR